MGKMSKRAKTERKHSMSKSLRMLAFFVGMILGAIAGWSTILVIMNYLPGGHDEPILTLITVCLDLCFIGYVVIVRKMEAGFSDFCSEFLSENDVQRRVDEIKEEIRKARKAEEALQREGVPTHHDTFQAHKADMRRRLDSMRELAKRYGYSPNCYLDRPADREVNLD